MIGDSQQFGKKKIQTKKDYHCKIIIEPPKYDEMIYSSSHKTAWKSGKTMNIVGTSSKMMYAETFFKGSRTWSHTGACS